MKIHHVGYAVKEIETSMDDFIYLGYAKIGEKCFDEKRNIYIQFLRNGEYVIELVAPASDNSPVSNILKKMGTTPYHICHETSDMAGTIAAMKSRGFMVIAEPMEAPAIEIRRVAFLFKYSTGIVELLETV